MITASETRVVRHRQRLEQLEAAIKWVDTLIGLPKSSRFPAYLGVWRAIADRADLLNGGVSDQVVNGIISEFGEMSYRGAIHEAFELVFIHEAFAEDSSLVPKDLLAKAVAGRLSELEETPQDAGGSSSARNFLFELTVATRFKRGGHLVNLASDADVEFNFRNYRVFIECKRLSSANAFERNYRKGSEQLVKRFEKFGLPKNPLNQRPVGILCFAMTKTINPSQLYLSSPTIQDATRIIEEETLNLLTRKEDLIKNKLHRNIILIGFYSHLQLRLADDFGSYMYWNFFPCYAADSRFGKVSKAIIDKMKSGMAEQK